jgi:amino acid permease
MIVMFFAWKIIRRTKLVRTSVMDLQTDRYDLGTGQTEQVLQETDRKIRLLAKVERFGQWLLL